jgi:hypothetical protein
MGEQIPPHLQEVMNSGFSLEQARQAAALVGENAEDIIAYLCTTLT